MKLSEISKPIDKNMAEFRKLYREMTSSKTLMMDTVMRYLGRSRGKQVRPMLVLLSAATAGSLSKRAYVGATMVELLHVASLVHDDVVDQSDERRGMRSVRAVYKNKVAVLVGDYMLARGLHVAVEFDEFDFLRVTSDTVKRMSEGELLQIQKSRMLNNDESTYFQIISDKTAALISACCEIGAISAGVQDEARANMKRYGELVGQAFQVRDDIFDYMSKNTLLGKPVGNDVEQKKLTLPLIYALHNSSKQEKAPILKQLKKGKAQRKEIVDFVVEHGGIAYAESTAQRLVNEAKACIAGFPESEYKRSMQMFADFSILRNS